MIKIEMTADGFDVDGLPDDTTTANMGSRIVQALKDELAENPRAWERWDDLNRIIAASYDVERAR